MSEYLFYCPSCEKIKKIDLHDSSALTIVNKCEQCSKPMIQTGIDFNRYYNLTNDNKKELEFAIKYYSDNLLQCTPSQQIDYCRKLAFTEDEINAMESEKKHLDDIKEKQLEEKNKKRIACSQMLISSGFNFDGYKIVKYSGYISGDDVVEVPRGISFLGYGATHAGSALTLSLVEIRRRALQELKEAAYDLGCNAVIGVDFDYITLEPETANLTGGTTYLPYVFCVTANGNAVIIEKDEPKQSAASIIKEYKELFDCGAITWEEFEAKKRELL